MVESVSINMIEEDPSNILDQIGAIKFSLAELKLLESTWVEVDERGKSKRKVPLNVMTILVNHLEKYNKFVATNRLYIWNGYKFDITQKTNLYKWVETIYFELSLKFNKNQASEIESILINRFTIDDPYLLNSNKEYIPFKNKYYHIKTNSLIVPDPALMFTYAFEFEYDGNVTCPHFIKFMEEFMPIQKDRRDILIFLAYSLTSSLDLQKALLLQGSGSNGKTIFFEIISYIWKNLHSKIALQKLDSQFCRVGVRGMLINIVSDLPGKRLEDEGAIKECITDMTLEDDEKYCARAKWLNTTKHIYGCNKIPLPPYSVTEGFLRRWIIKECNAKYKEKSDPDFDPKLHIPMRKFSEVLTELTDEAQGIINYLISFLPYIDELRSTNLKEILAKWNIHSENVLMFLVECCEIDPDYEVSISNFVKAYTRWCKKKNLGLMSVKGISMAIQDQGISSELKQITTSEGERDRRKVFMGVRLKPEQDIQNTIEKELVKKEAKQNLREFSKIILEIVKSMEGAFELEDVFTQAFILNAHITNEFVKKCLDEWVQDGTISYFENKYHTFTL